MQLAIDKLYYYDIILLDQLTTKDNTMSYNNIPDDWNSHWEYCDRHKYRYHATEWCHHCQDEDEQDSEEELPIMVAVTPELIAYCLCYYSDPLTRAVYDRINLDPNCQAVVVTEEEFNELPNSAENITEHPIMCFCKHCLN